MTASCEESSAQSHVTVVVVEKIQYYDPVAGWTGVPSAPYLFGASGTGQTVQVTFNTLSSDWVDYKTVTATCGNTVTVNALVFELEGLLTPDDNFAGRSQTRYGLAEKVELDFSSSPGGKAACRSRGCRSMRHRIIMTNGNPHR